MTREVISPQLHEAGAHLLFADPDNPNDAGLGRYFGFVSQFDQSFDLAETGDTFDAVDETWRINHNPEDDGPSINYWEGKILAEGQDYDAFYEYNIPVVAVDDTGEKKINFQFRPSLPNAKHVDSGNRIESMPEDLPEGLRVQIQSANIEPENYVPVLKGLFQALDVHTRYLEDIHPWSRLTAMAIYVRIDRDISERKLVDRDGLLERLARFSAVRAGRGEWKWDNEEILGHRTAVAMNLTALEKFYSGHSVGKLFKSYHMKNPAAEQGSVTYHPKFEIQWNKDHSPIKSAAWFEDGELVDRKSIRRELESAMYHAMHWANLPLDPGSSVYVADSYFTREGTVRDVDLIDDPTAQLEAHRKEVAVAQLLEANLTDKQEATVRETVASGGVRRVEEVAEAVGVSESTVRRTCNKLSEILEIATGKVRPADRVVAEKVRDVFASIDQVLEQGKRSLRDLAGQGELVKEESILGKWATRYAVQVDESNPGPIEIAINLGRLTEWEAIQIIRAGREAARKIGPRTHDRFVKAKFSFKDADGNNCEKGFGKFGYKYKIL